MENLKINGLWNQFDEYICKYIGYISYYLGGMYISPLNSKAKNKM